MLDFVSMIKAIVKAELAGTLHSAFGIVKKTHYPDASGATQYACDITLQGTEAVYEKVPLTTAYLGQLAPPIAGDMVVMNFIGGDPDQPIITGLVFTDTVPAPQIGVGERMINLPHSAKDADQIQMRQLAGNNGSREWRVTLPEGPELMITDMAISARFGDYDLSIDTDAGLAKVSAGGASLMLEENGAVTLNGDGDINIKAGGNLIMEAGGKTEITASSTMALQASKIDLN